MEKAFFTPEPVFFGAMGGIRTLPAGTLQAFRAGFECGTDVACVNVQLSKDNCVMVISSEALETVSEKKGRVSDYTADELSKLDAGYLFRDEEGEYSFRGKGYRFMTLKELFDEFPDKKFNVTLLHKSETLVKAYAGIVKACGAEERVLTSSMYGRNIKFVRQLIPASATAFSLPGIIGVYALFKSGLIYFKRNFAADALQTPEAIGVSYIANSGLIREMHKRGVKVHIWYVADRKQYQRAIEAGADGYMSDDILKLKSFARG